MITMLGAMRYVYAVNRDLLGRSRLVSARAAFYFWLLMTFGSSEAVNEDSLRRVSDAIDAVKEPEL